MKIILPHYVYEYWPHLLLLVCTLVIVLGWNTYVSVIGLLVLSAERSLMIFGWKNVHSFFTFFPTTRAGMFSRHSHSVVASKARQLPHV